jgi:hypothetical protein
VTEQGNLTKDDEKRTEATLARTTQFYRATIHHPFCKHFKSRFPAANVNRLLEWCAVSVCSVPTVIGRREGRITLPDPFT